MIRHAPFFSCWLPAAAALACLVPGMALADDPLGNSAIAPPANRQYVAVLVGVSDYANLPDDVELTTSASDVDALARVLENKANFNHVFTLTNAAATRDGIRNLLSQQVKPLLQPDDVMVLYITGHGMGADLGMPIFLAHDSTPENAQEDAFQLADLARDLQSWIPTKTTVIATDIIHAQNFQGLPFYGPAASDWPSMPNGTLLLSATQTETPAKEGAFAASLISALSGKADLDYDTHITQEELVTFLMNKGNKQGHLPGVAGRPDNGAVIATGFEPPPIPESPTIDISVGTAGTDGGGHVAATSAPTVAYPDVTISAAKFVFQEGDAQSVQCRKMPVTACTPSCYVREFKAGPCKISAVVDGVQMTADVPIFSKGKYDCERKAGSLHCEGPFL